MDISATKGQRIIATLTNEQATVVSVTPEGAVLAHFDDNTYCTLSPSEFRKA